VVSTTAAVPVTAVPVGRDYLRITPDRILAPVGSEVVLKAGICSAQGYLIANQRVEWLLSPSGTGEFVDLGERDQVTLFRPIWDTPTKFDNNYAITSTSFMPVCLDRGTPEPTDDVQILKGDAWITVTSAKEGASHVTAYAPSISDWNLRRAIATIYWVDAQWALPPSAVVEAGRPHVLTTTVMRRTDGAPLAGWLVRYDVGGGASLGYEGGNVVEVPTDAAGRASAEISPANVGGGSTTVGITIIRPPQAGTDPAPRLEIGRGAATITWASGATTPPPAASPSPAPAASPPFLPGPPPSSPGTTIDATPQPTLQNTPAPAGGYSPPPDSPPPGQARLDLQVRRETAEQVAVGEFARFQVTVTNLGTGTARNAQFRARFDRGLSHDKAPPGEYEIVSEATFDLAPNESKTMPLTFLVVAGGNQCHEVTVTAQDTEPVRATGCVTGAQATLAVTATGPRTRVVGEIGEFRATIRNTGDVEAKNVELVVRFDPPLEPELVPPGHERLQDGGILIRIPSLAPGTPQEFNMTARCRSSSNSACAKFFVTAEGGVLAASEACVEILPPRPAGAEPGAATSDLRVTVAATANPARTGQKFPLTVNLLNPGEQTIGPVELRVIVPTGLTPDTTQIQPQGQVVVQGQMLAFAPVPQLAAQQTLRYVIPVTAGLAGDVRVYASARAGGPGGASKLVDAAPVDIRILPQ
jgi:hypothetical protein